MPQIILVLIFAICSADFTCGNGSTIQSVLRECFNSKLMGFRVKIFKKQFACLLLFVLFIHKIS